MSHRQRVILQVLLSMFGCAASMSRGEVVAPLVTYSNPVPMSGEVFGRFAYSNGTYVFVADPKASENGLKGAVYQFNLDTGVLIHTFGSPEGANEIQFGDRDAIATVGDNLLVGDWAAKRQINTSGTISFGGLGYRFGISAGAYQETYSPVGHGTLTGGDYAAGICGVGNRDLVGWPFFKKLEIFDIAGGFIVRYDYLGVVASNFGAPIKPLGGSVVVGTGGGTSSTRSVELIDVATGAIQATMFEPRPTGGAVVSLFGESIATNAAGTRVLVGAYRGNTQANIGEGPGVAYLYDTSGNLLRAIDAPTGANGGFFGWDVEFLGDNLLVSAATNNASTGVVALFDGNTGALLRLYDGYGQGSQFGFSLGAVDNSRFVVGSLAGEAYLLPGPDACAGVTPDGDMNAGGTTDGMDIPQFTAALLAGSTSPPDRCHADFSGNGTVDLQDVDGFVARLVAP